MEMKAKQKNFVKHKNKNILFNVRRWNNQNSHPSSNHF